MVHVSTELFECRFDAYSALFLFSMAAIIAAGKSCGAQPEDIYGCFYFFLSRELCQFFRCIRAFKISFTVSAFEAGNVLPMVIRNGKLSNHGIPASIRFDRISVSNILDEEYVGMRQVLMVWSHFLAEGPHAALVGYFMNWFGHQHAGRLASAGEGAIRVAVRKLTKMTMVSLIGPFVLSNLVDFLSSRAMKASFRNRVCLIILSIECIVIPFYFLPRPANHEYSQERDRRAW